LINGLGSALAVRATCEILPAFDAERVWERLTSGEVTVFTAVPTIYNRLIASWEAAAPEFERSVGRRAWTAADDVRVGRASSEDTRTMARDQRPHAARAYGNDRDRHGALESVDGESDVPGRRHAAAWCRRQARGRPSGRRL
jgi:malonyl-CoA/methylmalonyl-CoA synthetase